MGLFKKIPILNAVFGDTPKLKTIPLDPYTQGLVGDIKDRAANMTEEGVNQELTEPAITASAQFEQTPQMASQEAARTGNSPGTIDAIRNIYRQNNARDIERFKNQMNVQSKLTYGERLNRASGINQMANQVNLNNMELQGQAYRQNQMARAQVISSILDLGGTAYMINQLKERSPTQAYKSGINSFNSGTGTNFGQPPMAVPYND